ncbi:MAG: hypothetical protein ND807_12965 [Vicinamibacterales bacterium]|nr:hypothetical protein [Vicinamibacterales bacterium]
MSLSFSEHIAVLEQVLAGRPGIVDDIERRLLNVRGKAAGQHSDRASIGDMLYDCFFQSPAVSRDAPLVGDLDPVDLILRAHHEWDRDRWPGRNGRIVSAQSLYAAFVVCELEHLSLKMWDDGHDMAAERLREVQRMLDLLNTASAAPRVRDARWLIQTAQGPLTLPLKPYFTIAGLISETLAPAERLEIHKAGSVLAGGHLRSQLRHRSRETGWAFDDPQLLALTRLSNSMDTALLVRDLIPLLEAYSAACTRQDEDRMTLADAILQGLSADPELLLTRLDLLAPSTMIENLFVDQDGQTRYTPMGEAHLDCLSRYGELIGRTAASLMKDAVALDPAHAAYSPFGMVYGFCADLLSNMVLNTLRSGSSADLSPLSPLSIEDMFIGRGELERKRAQAEEWQRLPKGEGERDPFEHSIEWATQMFGRLLTALEARAARPTEPNASAYPDARLFIVPRGVTVDSLPAGVLPPRVVSAQEHCLMSDSARARETGATVLSKSRLSTARFEGQFLGSQDAGGSWFGVSKAPVTIYTSLGKDAFVTDVPRAVIDVLRLVCPELLVVVDENGAQ